MKYTNIRNSDQKISKICLGTMTFGEQNSMEEAMLQMDMAIDYGINFFDTAEMYPVPANPATQGKTESYLGTWFKKTNKRHEIILATKITGPGRHVTHVAPDLRYTRTRIKEALHKSLHRLKTDYIDIYQLHWPERTTNCFGKLGYPVEATDYWEDNFSEVIETLHQSKEEGHIRFWGLSNETPWGVMRALNESRLFTNFAPVTIQNPYSFLNRTFEIGLSEMAMRENVGLLAYSPLAFGMLTGKYHDQTATSFARLNQFPQMARYSRPEVYRIAQEYIQVAHDFNMSPAQMAIAYILQKPFLDAAIIGATNLHQLLENIESFDLELPMTLINRIESIHNQHANPAP